MGKIVLCADRESLIRPGLIGLEEGSLEGREWLVPVPDGGEARTLVRAHDVDEAWVVGSDELTGINLAAALRKDRPDLPVFLILFNASGSELSRAAQAGVTATLSAADFCRKYDGEKRRRSGTTTVEVPFAAAAALRGEPAVLDESVALEEPADAVAAGSPRRAAIGATVKAAAAGATPLAEAATATMPMPACGVVSSPEAPGAAAATAPASPRKASDREGGGFVLSFLSGSGGVGKSTVTAVATYRAAARGFRTVAVDCDFQFGDLAHLMGVKRPVTVDDVLGDPDTASALAAATEDGSPALVAAPARLERSEALAGHLAELFDACASAFEVVLVNTGAHWTEAHAQLLEASAASVFLMDQRASSVHSCRHSLELCMRLGIASAPFVFALNRCKRGALFSAVDIANVLQGAHVFELKDGGPEVEEMTGAGLAAELGAAKNDLCLSVDAMLDDLLPSGGAAFGRRGRTDGRRSRKAKGQGRIEPAPSYRDAAGAGKPRGRRGRGRGAR